MFQRTASNFIFVAALATSTAKGAILQSEEKAAGAPSAVLLLTTAAESAPANMQMLDPANLATLWNIIVQRWTRLRPQMIDVMQSAGMRHAVDRFRRPGAIA